jgi:N-acetyl-alpha-D-glucosaminyl L-malate synthase BshA
VNIGITCYPTYGGSGAVATELGLALARRGHEVHFITYQQPFRLPSFMPHVFFHEVEVARYPLFEYPPYDLALAVRMHQVVLAHKIDLLHVHYAIPHATSAWIAKEMLRPVRPELPVITTLHGTDITIVGQDPSYHTITKFSIEKSDGLTAVSRFLQVETWDAFGCTACRIEVIPNFIDPQVYDRARYRETIAGQFDGAKRVLMHISNFRPVKRVRDIVQVFARVREEIPSVLVMVGDGPDRVVAEADSPMPPLTADDVRDTLERVRR